MIFSVASSDPFENVLFSAAKVFIADAFGPRCGMVGRRNYCSTEALPADAVDLCALIAGNEAKLRMVDIEER